MITQTLLDEAAVLLSACRKRRVKLAIAESCTGVPELIAVVGRSAVAQHMRSHADIAVSVTGVAGPVGGTARKQSVRVFPPGAMRP